MVRPEVKSKSPNDTDINGVFSSFISSLKLFFNDQLKSLAIQNKLKYESLNKTSENGQRHFTRFWKLEDLSQGAL